MNKYKHVDKYWFIPILYKLTFHNKPLEIIYNILDDIYFITGSLFHHYCYFVWVNINMLIDVEVHYFTLGKYWFIPILYKLTFLKKTLEIINNILDDMYFDDVVFTNMKGRLQKFQLPYFHQNIHCCLSIENSVW